MRGAGYLSKAGTLGIALCVMQYLSLAAAFLVRH